MTATFRSLTNARARGERAASARARAVAVVAIVAVAAAAAVAQTAQPGYVHDLVQMVVGVGTGHAKIACVHAIVAIVKEVTIDTSETNV